MFFVLHVLYVSALSMGNCFFQLFLSDSSHSINSAGWDRGFFPVGETSGHKCCGFGSAWIRIDFGRLNPDSGRQNLFPKNVNKFIILKC